MNKVKRLSVGWLSTIELIAVGTILGIVGHALAIKLLIDSTAVEAGATVALAFFAVVQMLIERKRAEERKADMAREAEQRAEAAEQRASFLAYDLRRKIMSWHRPGHPEVSDVFLWALSVRTHLGDYFDPAEERVDEISALAPRMGQAKRIAATQAIVLFLHTTNQVNKYLAENATAEAVVDTAGTISGMIDLVCLLDRELILEEMTAAQVAVEARQADAAQRIFSPSAPKQVDGAD